MVAPEARHLQGVRHATAGFVGKVLNGPVDVVVRHQHGVALGEQTLDFVAQRFFALVRQERRRMHGNVGGR